MKTYTVTEKGNTSTIQASSFDKAAALYFGVDKAVRAMGGKPNEFSNQRLSKLTFDSYRSAIFAKA